MRTEQEIYDLILGYAQSDARVRAVLLNGSRANPKAPKDIYQDYDVVYVVREIAPFRDDERWLDGFGTRLITQRPEAMRWPTGDGSFNWLMLFADGNRIDLTLIPENQLELLGTDSLTVVLLDKDGMLPPFPPSDDRDYLAKAPSRLFYDSCCNNFFWCLQNVAKGIARDELPYAMLMYHNVVREDLHSMLEWYIAVQHPNGVSAGKLGKYFKTYLPRPLYARYLATYSDCAPEHVWQSIYAACELFRTAAKTVGNALGYPYPQADDDGILHYLTFVQNSAGDRRSSAKSTAK